MAYPLRLTALAIAPLAGCASAPDIRPPALPFLGTQAAPAPLEADVNGPDGAVLGRVTLQEGPDGVLARIDLRAGSLPPGWHAARFHAKADCSDAAFQRAGPPLGAGQNAGGLLNPDGVFAGAMANIFAPAAGPFGAELLAPGVTLSTKGRGARASLLDDDGAALVLRAGPADHGASVVAGRGPLLACAEIQRE